MRHSTYPEQLIATEQLIRTPQYVKLVHVLTEAEYTSFGFKVHLPENSPLQCNRQPGYSDALLIFGRQPLTLSVVEAAQNRLAIILKSVGYSEDFKGAYPKHKRVMRARVCNCCYDQARNGLHQTSQWRSRQIRTWPKADSAASAASEVTIPSLPQTPNLGLTD